MRDAPLMHMQSMCLCVSLCVCVFVGDFFPLLNLIFHIVHKQQIKKAVARSKRALNDEDRECVMNGVEAGGNESENGEA